VVRRSPLAVVVARCDLVAEGTVVEVNFRLEKAQRLMVEAAKGADGVLAHPSPEAWVEEFGESAVRFAVRFWHAPDQATLWRVRSAVAIEVKRALDAAGIVIPFPQRVVLFPEQ